MTVLTVTCSGAYKNNGEMIDYDNEKITIPVCDEEWIKSNIINRALKRHFEEKKAKRFDSNYSCYIDKVDKNKKVNPSCLGKNIKELSWKEVQEAAILYNLFRVPLYKSTDLREARRICYLEYSNKILGYKLKEDFDFANARDIFLNENHDNPNKAEENITDIETSLEMLTNGINITPEGTIDNTVVDIPDDSEVIN